MRLRLNDSGRFEEKVKTLRLNLQNLRRAVDGSLFRDEAKKALKAGYKIRFHDWADGQYIEYKNKQIIDETGAMLDDEIFFSREGWHIYE